MATRDVVALNESTPQLEVPQTGDTYNFPRSVTIADGTIDFNIASHDGTNGLKLAGALVTADATELNYNDINILGTAQASKVLTLGGSGNLTLPAGGMDIGLGAAAGDDLTIDTDTLVVEGDNKRVGIGTTDPDTILDIDGAFTFREKSADPSNPDEGSTVMWMSDGTATGADGDVLMKITAGGVTKTTTLVDFSAI